MNDRIQRIRTQLETALNPSVLNIQDDSAKHIGHEGARNGAGHYTVTIVADAFNDKSLLQRHRLVYNALTDMMETEIHALSIQAKSPQEIIL